MLCLPVCCCYCMVSIFPSHISSQLVEQKTKHYGGDVVLLEYESMSVGVLLPRCGSVAICCHCHIDFVWLVFSCQRWARSLTAYGHEWPTERSNQFHLPTQHSTTYSPPSSVWLLISSDTDRFRRCHYCSLRHHSCYHHRVSVTVDEQMCVSLPVLSISIVPIYRVITVPYHSVLVASWSVYYHRVPTTTTTITVGVHVLEVWRSSVTMGLDPSWPLLTLQNRYLHRY